MVAFLLPVLLQAIVPAAQVAPPPPVISVPPVIHSSPRFAVSNRVPGERYTVEVEIRAGTETLWSGPMNVSTTQGANFSRQMSEAPASDCGPEGYGQQAQNSLSLQLNPQRVPDAGASLGVSVRWGRTIPGTCPYRNSSRTVELNETVALTPNKSVTLTGDAGLTVRLRRR